MSRTKLTALFFIVGGLFVALGGLLNWDFMLYSRDELRFDAIPRSGCGRNVRRIAYIVAGLGTALGALIVPIATPNL